MLNDPLAERVPMGETEVVQVSTRDEAWAYVKNLYRIGLAVYTVWEPTEAWVATETAGRWGRIIVRWGV